MAKARLTRHVVVGVLSQLSGIAVSLVTTPLLLHGLGEGEYGLWVLVLSVGSWVGFVGLIFNVCTVRYVGEAAGRGDTAQAAAATRGFALWAAIVGATGAAALAWLAPWMIGRIAASGSERVDLAIAALSVHALTVFIQVHIGVSHGVLSARQRLDLVYVLTSSSSAAIAVGGAWLAQRGAGVLSIVWWMAAVMGVQWAFAWHLANRLSDRPRAQQPLALGAWGGRFVAYGLPMLTGCAATQLFVPTSRILVGALRPLEEIAHFAVPSTLAGNLGIFANQISSAVMPAASERAGASGQAGVRQLYLDGLRWSWIALIPLCGLTLALGLPFIRVWIGREFAASVEPLFGPLMVGMSAYILSGVPSGIAQGSGRAARWALVMLVAGMSNAALAVWWIPSMGAVGAAYALTVAGVMSVAGILLRMNRALGLSFSDVAPVFNLRLLAVTAVVSMGLAGAYVSMTPTMFGVVAGGVTGALLILASAGWWLAPDERAVVRRQFSAAINR